VIFSFSRKLRQDSGLQLLPCALTLTCVDSPFGKMKTERVTLLASKEFKRFLGEEARRQGLSVAEFIRVRCEQKFSNDEAVLAQLAAELRKSLAEAKSSLKEGLNEAELALAQLRARRANTEFPRETRA
jgi:multidrug resistance efflux pump